MNRDESQEWRKSAARSRTVGAASTQGQTARATLGVVTLLASLLGGCMHPGPNDPARVGPFFAPANHSGAPSLGGVRRVVVLPVWGGQVAPVETVAEFDAIVVAALQHTQRFEVVSLSREDSRRRFGAEAFSSASALPHNLLATLRREFAAEAVMLIDLTAFSAYRPLELGLRAKLAAIDGSRLIWTFDTLFSAKDPTVANAARQHFLDADKRVPADMTHGALLSPSRFATYASTAMFATLPPVLPPPPVPAKR